MVPHGLPCLLIEGFGETESRFGTEGSEASVGVMGWRLGSVASDGVSPWAMVWRGQCLDDYDKGVAVSVGGCQYLRAAGSEVNVLGAGSLYGCLKDELEG